MSNYKRFVIWSCSFLLLFFLNPQSTNSCGYYSPDGGRVWFFLPNIANVPGLRPFTYSYKKYFSIDRDWDFSRNKPSLLYTYNLKEWQEVVGSNVPLQDIDTIQYHTNPKAYFNGNYDENNAFIKALRQEGNEELLAYFDFAKSCESIFNEEEWTRDDIPDLAALERAGYQLLNRATNSFVRLRTAYQLLKVHHYQENPEAVEDVFNAHFKDAPSDSWIQKDSYFYLALAQKDEIEYNYWLTRAFLAFDGRRPYLKRLMNLSTNKGAVIQRCEEREEKAAVELINQLDNPGRSLQALKYIYRIAPNYKDFPILLAREVNKLEDWIYSSQLLLEPSYKYTVLENAYDASEKKKLELRKAAFISDLKYLKELRQFVGRVITDKKQPDMAFWKLSGAYLAFMDEDYTKARLLLDGIQSEVEESHLRFQIQYATTQALVSIVERSPVSEQSEQYIYELIHLLEKHKDSFAAAREFQSQIVLLISTYLIQQGEKAKGALLLGWTTKEWDNFTFGASKNLYHKLLDISEPKVFEESIRILTAPQTSLEKWIASNPIPYEAWWSWYYYEDNEEEKKNSRWDIDKILDYQATHYIRNDQLDSAAIVLAKISESYWKSQPQLTYYADNPLSIGIPLQSLGGTDSPQDTLTKLEFLQKMAALKASQPSTDSARQAKYLLLANGYYNLSYHGSWWLASNPSWSEGELAELPKVVETEESMGSLEWPSERWPKAVWGLALFGLVGSLGLWRRGKRGISLRVLVVAISLPMLYASSCKWDPEDKEDITTDVQFLESSIDTTFIKVYYESDRAIAHYEKALAVNSQTEMGALAAYMLDRCELNRWWIGRSTYDNKWKDIGPTLGDNYKKEQPERFNGSLSCYAFQNFLVKTGWKITD